MAVPGVDLEGAAFGSDAEFDDPFRRPRPAPSAALDFGLPPQYGRDLGVDALDPQSVPGAQGTQAVQIGRQIIEHIFDSMLMIHPCPPRACLSCAIEV
ncbi:hypothetical protein ACYF6T_18785 [Streptomyces sp. 7R007]